MSQPQHDPQSHGITSERLRHWVHYSLLSGLVVSALLLTAGLVLALWRGEPRPGGPPPSLLRTVRGVLAGQPTAMLDLGLLALMITPVLRVAVLAVGWSLAGERRFGLTALTVLALLAASIWLGCG